MRIAISGASGFLGRPLVQRLAGAGHQVVALGRDPARMKAWLPAGVTAATPDPRSLPEVLGGCDAVVNLAGELIAQRWTPEVKARIRTSRIDGTRALAEAACAVRVKTFVSASAVGYYGPHGDEPLPETAPPGEDFLAQVCRDWEAATAPAKACGMRVPIVRIGLVLHPDGAVLKQMLPLFKLGVGGRIGSGAQYMSWIHRDDVLGLIEQALADPSMDGPYNAVAPSAVTNAEFSRALGKALHRPAVLPVPKFALKVAFGEMSQAVLTGQRAVPERTLKAGYQFRFATLDAALADFFPG